MINLLRLSKLIFFVIFFIFLNLKLVFAEEEPVDIWKQQEEKKEKTENTDSEQEITIESPILSEDINKIVIKINEDEISESEQSVIGIFDPEENNFDLNMWSETDGEEIKKVLGRIDKLKLAKVSEDLLFRVLFTNAYPPKKNLDANEFLKIKIDWLIKNKRIENLEILLKNNPEVGKNSKVIKFLIDEHISSGEIKKACEKTDFIDRKVQNNYLEKFRVYCLIKDERKNEAQLTLDLMKERGFNEEFFDDKINFLLGMADESNQKILDDNLLNFYLSHITSSNFQYEPDEKTDKYIWKYLSTSNLIKINDFENEEIIITYENAAAEDSFDNQEIFKIYLRMNFNFNQLANSREVYKNLPTYKARALIYQSILLSDKAEKKVDLALLLKDLFKKDKIFKVYAEELSSILKSIDPNEISESYSDIVKENISKNLTFKVKFDNEILHRSKVIKHFLEDNEKISRTEKDFKAVYKKIKRNKKYFISIKDVVVLESLAADGVNLPESLKYNDLSSQLTVPKNLQDLVDKNEIGLVLLKVVEIIGEDQIKNLDPETVYFLSKILNQLQLKKIRNNILREALPLRV